MPTHKELNSSKHRMQSRCIVTAWLKYKSNHCLLLRLLDKRVGLSLSSMSNDNFIGNTIDPVDCTPRSAPTWDNLVSTVHHLKRGGYVMNQHFRYGCREILTLSPGMAPCSNILEDFSALISTDKKVCLPTSFIHHLYNQKYACMVRQM